MPMKLWWNPIETGLSITMLQWSKDLDICLKMYSFHMTAVDTLLDLCKTSNEFIITNGPHNTNVTICNKIMIIFSNLQKQMCWIIELYLNIPNKQYYSSLIVFKDHMERALFRCHENLGHVVQYRLCLVFYGMQMQNTNYFGMMKCKMSKFS
jgi:hypothetical protein